MTEVYLLLGGNLGNRMETLHHAVELLGQQAGEIIKLSSVYETAPWGVSNQPDFYNQVVLIKTKLTPFHLLMAIQAIEIRLGRKRLQKWHSRTIDIDILYYGEEVINIDVLQIPHAEIHNRRFTLVPLQEIAPKLLHPVKQKNTEELLKICSDTLPVKKLALAEIIA